MRLAIVRGQSIGSKPSSGTAGPKRGPFVVAGIIIVLLIIVGVIGYLFVLHPSSSSLPNPSNTSASTTSSSSTASSSSSTSSTPQTYGLSIQSPTVGVDNSTRFLYLSLGVVNGGSVSTTTLSAQGCAPDFASCSVDDIYTYFYGSTQFSLPAGQQYTVKVESRGYASDLPVVPNQNYYFIVKIGLVNNQTASFDLTVKSPSDMGKGNSLSTPGAFAAFASLVVHPNLTATFTVNLTSDEEQWTVGLQPVSAAGSANFVVGINTPYEVSCRSSCVVSANFSTVTNPIDVGRYFVVWLAPVGFGPGDPYTYYFFIQAQSD